MAVAAIGMFLWCLPICLRKYFSAAWESDFTSLFLKSSFHLLGMQSSVSSSLRTDCCKAAVTAATCFQAKFCFGLDSTCSDEKRKKNGVLCCIICKTFSARTYPIMIELYACCGCSDARTQTERLWISSQKTLGPIDRLQAWQHLCSRCWIYHNISANFNLKQVGRQQKFVERAAR